MSSRVAGRVESRVESIDLARGLAVLAMLQTHAYDGWVHDGEHVRTAFAVTRFVALLALPAFLILAGIGLRLRVERAGERREEVLSLRQSLLLRALGIVAIGYAFSCACAVIDDGLTLPTCLRADVLHAIGLSLACLVALGVGVRARGAVTARDGAHLRNVALALSVAALFACPSLSKLGGSLRPSPGGYLLAPLIDVPGLTRMPMVPLIAWAGFGAAFAPFALRASPAALAVLGGAISPAATLVLRQIVETTGMAAARTNYAIVPNAIDLAGRALVVIALARWLALHLAGLPRRALLVLGRHSLLAYVLHMPFCYGRLAQPFARSLSMPAATLALATLTAGCVAACLHAEARDTLAPALPRLRARASAGGNARALE